MEATEFSFNGQHQKANLAILDICIFLPNQKGIHFSVQGGYVAPARDVQTLVAEYLGIQDEYKHAFALWMISPHLGTVPFY